MSKTQDEERERLNPSYKGTEANSESDMPHDKVLEDRASGRFGERSDVATKPTPYAWLVLLLMVLNSMFN